MKTTVALNEGCPVHRAIAEFLAVDARVLEVAPTDPTAPAPLEYMRRCNQRAQVVRVLMDVLPAVGFDYTVAMLAKAQCAEQDKEAAR